MENLEIVTPKDKEENIINNEKEIFKKEDYTKEYTINYNNLIYKLKMIIDDNENLSFKLNQTNNITNYYFKKYKYGEVKMKLNLNKDYKNIIEIFNLFDSNIKQNNLKLIKENNNISLLLTIIINKNPIQHTIPLEEKKLSVEENFKKINNEINEIKNDRELINQLIKSNEYLRNQNQMLLENQKILLEQITKLYERLDNKNNNDLYKECPRCNGTGKVPSNLVWDKDEKQWSYIEKYESPSISGTNYFYNYILKECPLCKGKKYIDITNYIRCPECKEICGYGQKSYFGNKVEFCKSCNGSGYFNNQ